MEGTSIDGHPQPAQAGLEGARPTRSIFYPLGRGSQTGPPPGGKKFRPISRWAPAEGLRPQARMRRSERPPAGREPLAPMSQVHRAPAYGVRPQTQKQTPSGVLCHSRLGVSFSCVRPPLGGVVRSKKVSRQGGRKTRKSESGSEAGNGPGTPPSGGSGPPPSGPSGTPPLPGLDPPPPGVVFRGGAWTPGKPRFLQSRCRCGWYDPGVLFFTPRTPPPSPDPPPPAGTPPLADPPPWDQKKTCYSTYIY